MQTLPKQQNEIVAGVNKAYTPPLKQRPDYKTVEQFSNDNPAFSPSALRNLIFKAEVRHTTKGVIEGNGLLEAGAIVRIGRKVLIEESRFYSWVQSQNREVQK
jgi:hypothetical protein